MPDWFVYMVHCADGSLYTGVARDPLKRLVEHNEGKAAARYTRARRPVSLVYVEGVADRSAACKRESAVKRLPRRAKVALIASALAERREALTAAGVEFAAAAALSRV